MTANAKPTASAGSGNAMPNVWCVRADHGEYTEHFVRGGYFGYGAQDWGDFSTCQDKSDVADKLAPFFASKQRRATYASMMSCFLFGIQAGDWVITPEKDSSVLRYGQVLPGDCWYEGNAPGGDPSAMRQQTIWAAMRRKIIWAERPLQRDQLPVPLRNTIKSTGKTVFAVKHRMDFLDAIR